jgi:hypothetical protein
VAQSAVREPINIASTIAAMVFELRNCIDTVLRLMEQRTCPRRGSEGGFVANRIDRLFGLFGIPREEGDRRRKTHSKLTFTQPKKTKFHKKTAQVANKRNQNRVISTSA